MSFFRRSAIQVRILAIILSGGVFAITLFLTYWAYSEDEHQKRAAANELSATSSAASLHLKNLIHNQYLILETLSHSLALRRHIIKIGQENIRKPPSVLQQDFQNYLNLSPVSSDANSKLAEIQSTLETKFLQDMIKASDNIIDRIDVTDAFGIVRLSTSIPDQFIVFNHTWWQNTLQITPGHYYLQSIAFEETNKPYWDISCPLWNDDGTDPVGIIRMRLRFDRMIEKTLLNLMNPDTSTHFLSHQGIYPPLDANFTLTSDDFNEIRIMHNGLITDKKRDLMAAFTIVLPSADPGMPNKDWYFISFKHMPIGISFENPTFRNAVLLWLAGVLILTLIGLILSRWISDPLLNLTRGVKEIIKGKFDIRVPAMGYGEIASLGNSFNTMVRKLAESRNKVNALLNEVSNSLKIVTELSHKISEIFDIRAIANVLLELSAKHVQADAGFVLLYNGKDKILEDNIITSLKLEKKLIAFIV
ncbi:HAMP domain-containing protein, partial [bacterium]|nr:HAMP domain-containing protein [candidate division CSSED10-310 bacterium]